MIRCRARDNGAQYSPLPASWSMAKVPWRFPSFPVPPEPWPGRVREMRVRAACGKWDEVRGHETMRDDSRSQLLILSYGENLRAGRIWDEMSRPSRVLANLWDKITGPAGCLQAPLFCSCRRDAVSLHPCFLRHHGPRSSRPPAARLRRSGPSSRRCRTCRRGCSSGSWWRPCR